MAARAACPQLDPSPPGRQAFLASLDLLGYLDLDLVEVRAFGHDCLLLDGFPTSRCTRSQSRSRAHTKSDVAVARRPPGRPAPPSQRSRGPSRLCRQQVSGAAVTASRGAELARAPRGYELRRDKRPRGAYLAKADE